MAELNQHEIDLVKKLLAARKKGDVIIVNGRPFDTSRVRKPIVAEDAKHTMYANPRLMLKDKTKPTYEKSAEHGVEYEWLLKGSYERLRRKKDYRPVLTEEVDWASPFCKLDANKNPVYDRETGASKNIVCSGEFELYEVRGEAAYLLKRYGADAHLSNVTASGPRALNIHAQDSRLSLNQTQFIADPEWQPAQAGNIADPETWGGGSGKHV